MSHKHQSAFVVAVLWYLASLVRSRSVTCVAACVHRNIVSSTLSMSSTHLPFHGLDKRQYTEADHRAYHQAHINASLARPEPKPFVAMTDHNRQGLETPNADCQKVRRDRSKRR